MFAISKGLLPPQYMPHPPESGTEFPSVTLRMIDQDRETKPRDLLKVYASKKIPVLSVWLTDPSSGGTENIAQVLLETAKEYRVRGVLVLVGNMWNPSEFASYLKDLDVGFLDSSSQIAKDYNLNNTKLNVVIAIDPQGKVFKTASGLSSRWVKGMPGPYQGPLDEIRELGKSLSEDVQGSSKPVEDIEGSPKPVIE